MGRLVVTEFMTVDGVGQAPGGSDEDLEGGFSHGGWMAPIPDHGAGAAIFQQAASMDALLLGRRTYQIFAGYWPTAPAENPFSGLLNSVPRYVASRTLREPLGWTGTTVLVGELEDAIVGLKQRHQEIHVIGSLDLVQSLLRLRLVDRLDLWQYPLVLGTGKRVFDGGTVPAALRLSESVTHGEVLQLTYEVAGVPGYGDMGAEVS